MARWRLPCPRLARQAMARVRGILPAQFLPQQVFHRPVLLNPQIRLNFQTTDFNRRPTEHRPTLNPLHLLREATATVRAILLLRGLANYRTRVNLPTLL